MTSVKAQVKDNTGSSTKSDKNTGITTSGSNQPGEITTLSQITAMSNGIPAPAKTETSRDVTTQNESESSDSDGNSVNNMHTSSNLDCAIKVSDKSVSHKPTMQNKNSSHITTKTSQSSAVQSPRKYEGVHQFRPRRKDGGAHWYRSSAVILASHR